MIGLPAGTRVWVAAGVPDMRCGFNAVYESGRVQEAACWAHARRKFYELHAVRPNAVTEQALARIGELYDIEREIRGQPTDRLREIRQREAIARLTALEAWLEETMASRIVGLLVHAQFRFDARTYSGIAYVPSSARIPSVPAGRSSDLQVGQNRLGSCPLPRAMPSSA